MTEEIPQLFGTSGIRGKMGDKITLELALKVGLAVATFTGSGKKIVIGHDPRTSSPMMALAVKAGIIQCGCDVLDLGMVPTPVVGYAAQQLGAHAGVMITASHNPSQFNGIKLWNPDGMAYRQEQERAIEKIVHQESFERVSWDSLGEVEDIKSFIPTYMEGVLAKVNIKPGLKIVVDCANGAASHLSPLILRRAGCQLVTLNSQPDGFFPGRNPEPSESNLGELMKVVKATGADLGIAHDGDADRMVAVDDQGRMADFDKLLALVSAQIGGTVVTTVDASAAIDRCLKDVGGKVVRTKVGDVHVAEKLSEIEASFGGEPSGTWIHPNFCMCPDGILSGLRVIEMVQKKGPLSQLLDEQPTYPTLRVKLDCADEYKQRVMEEMEKSLPYLFSDVMDLNSIDGVRLTLSDDSWVLVRPSGTESYIRITLEGKSQNRADNILKKSEKLLSETIESLKE
ncbi:MAG TPA: phosphoglucosamine mutase [Methanobacteriaceae archaeon]|nr:phosphoglucosamine mutase [Methanobacteriaceae archaeon]